MDKIYFLDSFLDNKPRAIWDIVFANIIAIVAIILSAFIPIFSLALPIILFIYLETGLWGFVLKKETGKSVKFEDIFLPLKNIIKVFCVFVLKTVMFIFGTVLFIVPGIISATTYAFTPMIIFESPDLDAKGVLMLSKELSKGYRLKILFAFLLCLTSICATLSLAFYIVFIFDVFFEVASFVYIVVVLTVGIFETLVMAIPMYQIVIVDCFIDSKNKKVSCKD